MLCLADFGSLVTFWLRSCREVWKLLESFAIRVDQSVGHNTINELPHTSNFQALVTLRKCLILMLHNSFNLIYAMCDSAHSHSTCRWNFLLAFNESNVKFMVTIGASDRSDTAGHSIDSCEANSYQFQYQIWSASTHSPITIRCKRQYSADAWITLIVCQ